MSDKSRDIHVNRTLEGAIGWTQVEDDHLDCMGHFAADIDNTGLVWWRPAGEDDSTQWMPLRAGQTSGELPWTDLSSVEVMIPTSGDKVYFEGVEK